MDRFEAMQLFVSVAERQSFARAARDYGFSAARVTRAVAALEAIVGARLLHRTTRAVRLTEAGATYLSQCKRILSEVEAAESSAASSHRELSGTLTLTAPVLFGRLHVGAIVSAFLKRHPRLSMRVLFSDSVLDFFDQNIDVAVRIANLPDSNLRAQTVGTTRRVLCAAPSYLRTRGIPQTPADLAQHDTIVFTGQTEHVWTFAAGDKHERVHVRPRLIVNSADLCVAAARDGHGVTRVFAYQAADDLLHKRLKIVLASYELPPVPVHIVHLEGREASARVRAFVEFAAPRLRASCEALGRIR